MLTSCSRYIKCFIVLGVRGENIALTSSLPPPPPSPPPLPPVCWNFTPLSCDLARNVEMTVFHIIN